LADGFEDHFELGIIFSLQRFKFTSQLNMGGKYFRNRTKALMISILTFTALGLFKTLDSMATPSSVKAYGG
jgi:hypothetical protein